MFLLKYKKDFPANLIAHTDLLNIFSKIIKRAGLKVNFSNGYNPHYLINFGAPNPLGTFSSCEFVFINSSENKNEFIRRFNENSIKGLKAIEAYNVEKDPNVYLNTISADYLVSLNCDLETAKKIISLIEEKKKNNDLFINYTLKGSFHHKNVSANLYDIRIVQNKNDLQYMSISINNELAYEGVETLFIITAATGNENLRVDRLFNTIKKLLNLSFEINYVQKVNVHFKDDFVIKN